MRTTQGGLVARFDDPAAFAASIHNAHASVKPIRAGAYQGQLTLVRLSGIHLVQMRETVARRFVSHPSPARLFFRLKPEGDPASIRNGEEEPAGTLHVNRNGAKVDDLTPDAALVRNLSISLIELAERCHALLDRSVPGILGDRARLRPAPQAFAILVALHGEAARLAAETPSVLSHPVSAAMLDARICEALLAVLDSAAAAQRENAATRRGHAIMRRAMDFIDGHETQPITLTQLCTVARCSAKRLELLFHETLGQTPMRYLRQRRLWLARRCLLAADPRTATVARVAMECGFWELGRFAAAYRQEFGELPSQTLRATDRAVVEAPIAA